MARKLVEFFFGFFSLPPQKKQGTLRKNLSKMKKNKFVQNCLKWRENQTKTSFGLFSPPTKTNLGEVQNLFVENEKNQSCSKLPEMARTLVENEILTFQPPHPKKIWGDVQNFFVKNEKIKVVQNCLKWQENWSKMIFWIFDSPLHQKKI